MNWGIKKKNTQCTCAPNARCHPPLKMSVMVQPSVIVGITVGWYAQTSGGVVQRRGGGGVQLRSKSDGSHAYPRQEGPHSPLGSAAHFLCPGRHSSLPRGREACFLEAHHVCVGGHYLPPVSAHRCDVHHFHSKGPGLWVSVPTPLEQDGPRPPEQLHALFSLCHLHTGTHTHTHARTHACVHTRAYSFSCAPHPITPHPCLLLRDAWGWYAGRGRAHAHSMRVLVHCGEVVGQEPWCIGGVCTSGDSLPVRAVLLQGRTQNSWFAVVVGK